MKLVSSQRVSPLNSKHNAFTDMIVFKQRFYICYREATNHVSKDGCIRILHSSDGENWQSVAVVREPLTDLRDPKLSVDQQGRLSLLFYRKLFNQNGKNIENRSHISFSNDGVAWSASKAIAENNWWLWRLTWQQNKAYGLAYNRGQNTVRLYAGDPFRSFDCIDHQLFSLARFGKGYPNESQIVFQQDNTALCLLRRDADSGSAQLGIAKTPYRQWQWIDLAYYLGGPNLIELTDGRLIVCARVFTQQGPSTYLFELKLTKTVIGDYNAYLQPLFALPSAGDNSYSAMVEVDGKLLISYYSEHEYDSCQIYLAQVQLVNLNSG